MLGSIDLIHESVLNVDAAGIRANQISNEFFVGGRGLERIPGDDSEKTLCLGFEIRGRQLPGVLLRLLRENDGPTHQPGLPEDFASGSAMPLRMESRIPGTERR